MAQGKLGLQIPGMQTRMGMLQLPADTVHRFTPEESDWGFTAFMPLRELLRPENKWLRRDGSLVLEVPVEVCS